MKLMPQSPTSVGTFNTCPRQYQAKYITKEVVFKPTAATERGTRWHKNLEERIKDKVVLPEDVAHFETVMQKLESFNGEVLTETTLAVDANFDPCEWKQRYIGGNIDFAVINHEERKAVIFDYKTGKVKDNDDFQFQLLVYATLVLKAYPHIQSVRVAFLFLDHCKISPRGDDKKLGVLYTRDELPIMQGQIFHNIDRIRLASERNEFIPTPSGLCKKSPKNGGKPWCEVISCPFWGK